MRTILYDLSILILRALLPLSAKFSPKVNLFYQGRKNLLSRIKSTLEGNRSDLFWVHCSSVGEFEQGLPVIELLKKKNPNWKVVVTFFSPSGYEAVSHKIIDYKFYLPHDTVANTTQFINLVKPKIALFIKYEFWYHYLHRLHSKSIPTFSVSSILRPTQTFFKWYGGWNRKMLQKFAYFMVQDKTTLELLQSIGLSNAAITGDTRFDRVSKIKEDTLRFPEIENFVADASVFIIGSLRPEDNETIFSFINAHPEFTFILAPHEIDERYILKIENSVKSTVRHSLLKEDSKSNVLIIDSIGKLSRLYRLAHFAYIGGGFSDGIHNILEPAVYNIPIFFGNKYYKKYKEATDLVNLQAAFPVANSTELTEKLAMLKDENLHSLVTTTIEEYVNNNKGAAEKVVKLINQQSNK